MPTHLSLFSGIGGLDLAAEWAGFETVGQCEWADYPFKVLCKHWPDVPKWRDIRTLTKESFYERTGLRTVDIISGGFPCQPFSVAGKRRGAEDDRYLWPEMCRVIAELQPTWVVGENVAGIVNMALDTVLSDLEAQGYAARTFIIPACGVGAPHRRYRAAIVAYHANSTGEQRRKEQKILGQKQNSNAERICQTVAYCEVSGKRGLPIQQGQSQQENIDAVWSGETMANADSARREKFDAANIADKEGFGTGGSVAQFISNTDSSGCGRQQRRQNAQQPADGSWWAAEPRVGRVADGIPNRMDRIRCLGNAVVPQQFYPIFKTIAVMEGGEEDGRRNS